MRLLQTSCIIACLTTISTAFAAVPNNNSLMIEKPIHSTATVVKVSQQPMPPVVVGHTDVEKPLDLSSDIHVDPIITGHRF